MSDSYTSTHKIKAFTGAGIGELETSIADFIKSERQKPHGVNFKVVSVSLDSCNRALLAYESYVKDEQNV